MPPNPYQSPEGKCHGLLFRLRHWILGTTIRDPLFGRLELNARFVAGAGTSVGYYGYWQGRVWFRPLGREVGIILTSPGPSEAQRLVFREVEARWAELQECVNQPLVERLRTWVSGTSGAEQVEHKLQIGVSPFELLGIDIQSEDRSEERRGWEGDFSLAYGASQVQDHDLVAHFKNWKLTRVEFE